MSNNLNDDVKNASRAASNHENTSQDPKAPKMLKPRIDTFERKPKMKDPQLVFEHFIPRDDYFGLKNGKYNDEDKEK